jgi:hypothetical protein
MVNPVEPTIVNIVVRYISCFLSDQIGMLLYMVRTFVLRFSSSTLTVMM